MGLITHVAQKRVFVGAVTTAVVVTIAACSDTDDTVSPPPTIAQRCKQSCDTPRDDEHPCHGQMSAPTCASSCEATLAGKSDECVTCYLGYSGWRGTTCSCAGDERIGNIGCSECSYRAGGKSCEVQLINKCTDGATSCDGWVGRAIEDPICAEKCGIVVDPNTTWCNNLCQAPTSAGDPCGAPSEAQRSACVTQCLAAVGGASESCRTCYAAGSAWMGQACTCEDGTCVQCNWSGRGAKSAKSCVQTSCSRSTPSLPTCVRQVPRLSLV